MRFRNFDYYELPADRCPPGHAITEAPGSEHSASELLSEVWAAAGAAERARIQDLTDGAETYREALAALLASGPYVP